MLTNNVEVFESKAGELMEEAVKLSREANRSEGCPPPEEPEGQLRQLAVVSFVSATKILLWSFHHDLKETEPPEGRFGG